MKRTLALLALFTFTLSTLADDQIFTGAYWTTKAPVPLGKEAGQFDLTLRLDNTVLIQCYFNSSPSITATGRWSFSSNKQKIHASAELGQTDGGLPRFALFDGFVNGGFANGSFSILYNGIYKGKWQATTP